jgi:putative membrane protein
VHLAYGLLIAYPAYELLERYARPAGAWSYILAPALIMATSLAFEVVEWWAAAFLDAGVGSDYVGAQGDEWDAQKDMALATGGAIITMTVTALLS